MGYPALPGAGADHRPTPAPHFRVLQRRAAAARGSARSGWGPRRAPAAEGHALVPPRARFPPAARSRVARAAETAAPVGRALAPSSEWRASEAPGRLLATESRAEDARSGNGERAAACQVRRPPSLGPPR